MSLLSSTEPLDYLAVGHITRDLTPSGARIGGTVTYAALTAQALGLRAGILTSWGEDVELDSLSSVPIVNVLTESSTTFRNIETSIGRQQTISNVASNLEYHHLPDQWKNATIVHLGPIAGEIDPSMIQNFSAALIGSTPQGWLREWDENGVVSSRDWQEAAQILEKIGAAVISLEDIGGNELRIEEMAAACPVLAVTEGKSGVRLYWNGDVRRFRPPEVKLLDTTGAGDIFAAAFFTRLYTTRDPWEAARFATALSAFSVTREGLESIPTQGEIRESMIEVY